MLNNKDKTTREPTVIIGFRAPRSMRLKLEQIAKRKDRTLSYLMVNIVKQSLASQNKIEERI